MRVRKNKLFNLPPSNKNPCKNAIVRSVLIRGETTFMLEPVARFWRLAVSAESRPVRKSQSASPSDVSPHSSMAKPNLPTVTLGPGRLCFSSEVGQDFSLFQRRTDWQHHGKRAYMWAK